MPDIQKKRAPSVTSDQRAWTTVYDDINDIINSVNQKSAVESRNGSSGLDGDIRLFKDVDKAKYFIEGKFRDGWAKRELLFSDSNNETQDESINFSSTESYVKPDGTVPFTAAQTGVAPSNNLHLATKKYVDDTAGTEKFVSAGSFDETNGNLTLTVTGGSNVGVNIDDRYVLTALKHGTGGGDIVKNITTGTMNYKSIKQGGSITVTNNTDDITIAGGGLTTVALGSDVTGILPIGNGGTGGDDEAEARNNLGVDPLGTDNSTDVTLAGTLDYVTIGSGADKQKLTLGAIVLTTDVSGNLPDGNIASSATWNGMLDSVLAIGGVGSVDIVSDSNDYTSGAGGTAQLRKLKGTGSITVAIDGTDGHINIGGGGLTSVDLTANVSGVLPIANGGTNSTTAANALAALGGAALNHNHSGTYDNYASWTAKDHDGTVYTLTSGDTLWIKEGTGIDVNFTADDELTITNTAPDVDHFHWDGSDTGLNDVTGRASLGLGTAAQSATGDFAAASHNHSAGDINSGTLAEGRGGTGVTSYAALKTALNLGTAAYVDLSAQDLTDIGNLSGTNTGDQTLPTRASLGIDTDDNVAFAQVSCEDGMFVLDTTDESGTNAGFKKNGTDRIDIGWGGAFGANMELYSKSHSSRPGEFKLIYGTGSTAGDIYYTHKGSGYNNRGRMTHDGNWHVAADVYAYSSSVGSDRKLKKNIVDTKYGLKDVLKLRGVDFDWKEKRNKAHDVGVIAQEIREVIPEVVMEVEDLNGDDTHLTVDYAKLVPVLIESIKELNDRLDKSKCR